MLVGLKIIIIKAFRQKAFRRGDGLCDSVCLLRAILRDRTRRRKTVNVTFVDVALYCIAYFFHSLGIEYRGQKIIIIQGGPKKLYIFQHTISLEPFKTK